MTTIRGQHLIGKTVGGCVLESLLGYGGSSAVFLARQHDPERQVAVKVFLPRSTLDGKMRKDFYIRFLREAEAASELDHPNILPIYSYGEQDDLPYIIMPYMPGGTLYEYARKRGRLSRWKRVAGTWNRLPRPSIMHMRMAAFTAMSSRPIFCSIATGALC